MFLITETCCNALRLAVPIWLPIKHFPTPGLDEIFKGMGVASLLFSCFLSFSVFLVLSSLGMRNTGEVLKDLSCSKIFGTQ